MSASYGDSSALNAYFASRSYVAAYLPSSADITLLKDISAAPDANKFPHLARWYKHMQSYSDNERSAFPSQAVPAAVTAKASNGAAAPAAKGDDDDDDDDMDLFGSDDDEEETEAAKAEKAARVAAYEEKKKKKPQVIAKSNIILDVKPWGDETDMEELEKAVRTIELDGLLWGASKLVPIGYGIKKLQIGCVVEDSKVGSDLLEEKITDFEDLVQSVDIAAFQKI
jgi:elongation factor 1-beta